MLTIPERTTMAANLLALREKLINHTGATVHELPPDLQKSIRSFEILNPITSSGIERVRDILTRIIWAVYYLKDEEFPANYEEKKNQPPVKEKPRPVSQESQPIPLVPQPPARPNPTIDFGPFDPRARN